MRCDGARSALWALPAGRIFLFPQRGKVVSVDKRAAACIIEGKAREGADGEVITMAEQHETCPCRAVRELEKVTRQHSVQLAKHDERLERGNVQFVVISTKLNIIMAILSAVGIAVCGALISLIL